MKVLLFLLLFSSQAGAQATSADSVNRKRAEINRTGLTVLGSWALLNIGSGVIAGAQTTGRQMHFSKINAVWGGVNLVLAGIGYWREKNKPLYSLAETIQKQTATEKIFLFNSALDLGYITFGLYLRERASRFTGEKRARLMGTGDSFLAQGGFLVLFDGVMYLIHATNGRRLFRKLQHLHLGASENGFGIIYRF